MSSQPRSAWGSSLSIREVSKTHLAADGSTVLALDRITLDVAGGEILALVGPSGCGKSTLLRMIAGLEPPTAGELLMGTAPITGPGAERGLMFQDHCLFPWLSIRKNIESGPLARGTLRQCRHEVEEFMRLVGLGEFADVYPHQLSGGMAQRAALARALVNNPRVLLLDEPLGALDQFTRMRMQDEILRLWEIRGTTMVLVTHDIDEAIYTADRIAIMTPRPGRIERVMDVQLERPRQRNDRRFTDLRVELLETLHLTGGSSGTTLPKC